LVVLPTLCVLCIPLCPCSRPGLKARPYEDHCETSTQGDDLQVVLGRPGRTLGLHVRQRKYRWPRAIDVGEAVMLRQRGGDDDLAGPPRHVGVGCERGDGAAEE